MNLKFWQKNPSPEEDGDQSSQAPSILAQIKARVTALLGRVRVAPPFQAGSVNADDESSPMDKDASTPDAPVDVRKKAKRIGLIVGGIALLLSLMIGIGYASWKMLKSSPAPTSDPLELVDELHIPSQPIDRPASEPLAMPTPLEMAASSVEVNAESAVPLTHVEHADAPSPISAPIETPTTNLEHHDFPASSVTAAPLASAEHPASHIPTTDTAEIAALRKKNAELQSELRKLKGEQRRRTSTFKLHQGQPAAIGGSVTVENADPKATADTLKSAIDAMNNVSGDYQNKPVK